MSTRAEVRPNRRGMRSRELVLDAAERVMAQDGFEAATVARVVEEAGIPLSSVYHYYGSKDRILLAVMERGAERFFNDLPMPDQRLGRPATHLGTVVSTVARTLERHPNFLRLLIVFAVQPPARSLLPSWPRTGRFWPTRLEKRGLSSSMSAKVKPEWVSAHRTFCVISPFPEKSPVLKSAPRDDRAAGAPHWSMTCVVSSPSCAIRRPSW